jgi:hypothetical protein
MNRTRFRALFVGLAAWMGLAGLVSCLSSDDTPRGGHVEHPVDPGPKKGEPNPIKAPPPPSLAPPPASAAETPSPSEDRRPSRSERYEENIGIKLSPLDKAILDDCPNRAWSKNVPERRCTKDDECGDGFCDRERCAPFWTCSAAYGMRCERDEHCGLRPCIDGRCRSCVSDTECKRVRIVQDGKCTPDPWLPGARECSGVVRGSPPTICRNPWAPKIPGDNTPECPHSPPHCQGPNKNAPGCK